MKKHGIQDSFSEELRLGDTSPFNNYKQINNNLTFT